MSEQTDEDIVKLVQAGNQELFGELVARYEAKLLRYGRQFLRDTDDVKDLVQEAFIKAYQNLQSFDTGRRFSPWIYRIAHNEFVNGVKKRWREHILDLDFDLIWPQVAARETADGPSERADLRRVLERGLSQLSAKYREPLVLYYFEDLSYREISDILHLPPATVGIRLRRGRAMLKAGLQRSLGQSS